MEVRKQTNDKCDVVFAEIAHLQAKLAIRREVEMGRDRLLTALRERRIEALLLHEVAALLSITD